MGHSQGVFLGEVDRISNSGNAIVNQEDVRPLHRTEKQSNGGGHINLGPLPPETAGEEVLFTYEGGTSGCCIETRYINRDYIQEMSGHKLSVGILEMIDPGDILSLRNIVQIPEDLPTDAQYLALARIPPVPTEDSSEISQTSVGVSTVLIQDSTIQIALPTPVLVEVTEISSTYIETTRVSNELQYNLPDTGETITVTMHSSQTERGTLATYEADCLLRVVIEDAQYPSGETIQIKVTDIKSTHIVGEAVFSADDFDIIAINENKIPSDRRQSRSRVVSQKVPIDIEPLPDNAPVTSEVVVTGEDADALTGRWNVQDKVGFVDITRGDEVEVEIQSICESTCRGHHNQFPIQIKFDRAVPTELKHQSISVLIQTVHADRAIANPIWITGAHDELDVQVIGKKSGDAIAINEGHLIIIPESSVVSPGHQLRVSPSESSDNDVPAATVSARPIFQDAETTRSIRLPNTRGDVVYINKTPVVVDHLPELDSTVTLGVSEVNEDHIVATVSARPTLQDTETTQLVRLPNTRGEIVNVNSTPVVVDHLPDLDSTVTLGVSEVNKDHIVPTVDALPEPHLPDEGSYISATPQKTTGSMFVSVEEELPLKLPLELPLFISTRDNSIAVQVLERRSGLLLGVVSNVNNDTGKLSQVYEHLRLAVLSFQQRKYENAVKYIDEASQSCPSEFPTLERLLAVEKIMIRVILSIRGSAEFTDTAHMLSQELNRLRECETEGKFIEFDAFLSAREAEMQAAERLLTALTEVGTDAQTKLQAIAKGVSAKPPAVKATEHLTMAEKSVTGTVFEDQIPSVEMQVIIQEFEESFPGILDELQSFDPPGDDADWLRHFGPEWITDRTETALPNTEAGGDTWSRPATPETMGITPMTEIENNNNAHIESAQNSDTETSTTEQTSTSNDDSEGGTETTSAGGTSSGTPTAETNETETQTEPESSTGPTNSTGESPPTNLPKLQELRRRAEKESSENPEREDVSSSTTTTSRYKRSSAVREYALARAEGTCEACKKDAPFLKENGDPYLEVHHVNELSEGGADDPSIVGAVCPSCHKEIHYGKHGNERNEELRERLQEGLGDAGVVDK